MAKHDYPKTRPDIDILPISKNILEVMTAWDFVASSPGAEAVVCDYDAPEWRLSYRREIRVIEVPKGDVGRLVTEARTFDSQGKLLDRSQSVWKFRSKKEAQGIQSGISWDGTVGEDQIASDRPRVLEVSHQYEVIEEWLQKGEIYRHDILLEVKGVYAVRIGPREYTCILVLQEARGRGHGEPMGQANRRTLVQYYIDTSDGAIVLFRRFDGPGYYDISRLAGSAQIVRGDIVYRHRYDCVRTWP